MHYWEHEDTDDVQQKHMRYTSVLFAPFIPHDTVRYTNQHMGSNHLTNAQTAQTK